MYCIRRGNLIQGICSKHLQIIKSLFSHTSLSSPRVCIVGSGPAGFYTAQQLLKGNSSLTVDIYDRLPVPFGLVRFGVAPDHPEVKNVINTFTQTANNTRCNFLGNVNIGQDVRVSDLQKAYHAVVMCYGASEDRRLGIPGEDLTNVLSARRFVGWYNGLPEDANIDVDLDCETAVIIGHGNVAVDVARILLTPVELLSKSDITEYALEVISKSRVKNVYLVGRRGPLQVAFTIKELRELIRLPGTKPAISADDVRGLDQLIDKLPRPRRRLTELMYKTSVDPNPKDTKYWADADKQWHLKFLRSPKEIIPQLDSQRISSVELTVNQLQEKDGRMVAIPTEQTETIECGLVFRSVGYKSRSIDDALVFDEINGIIPSKLGRVTGKKGLYCSGWVSRGPAGVILDTMSDGFNTGKTILEDIKSDVLGTDNRGGIEEIGEILKNKNIQVTSFSDWEKIDKVEQERGAKVGKPREKIGTVEEMLRLAR